jgi:hypothetical protein
MDAAQPIKRKSKKLKFPNHKTSPGGAVQKVQYCQSEPVEDWQFEIKSHFDKLNVT